MDHILQGCELGYTEWSWCPLAGFTCSVNLLKVWKSESSFLYNAPRFAKEHHFSKVTRLRPSVPGKRNFAMKMSTKHSSNDTDSGKPKSSVGETSPRATLSNTNATWTDPGWNPDFRVCRRKLTPVLFEHLSSRCTASALLLQYENQMSTVQGNNRFWFWDACETHKYATRIELQSFCMLNVRYSSAVFCQSFPTGHF